MEIVVTTDNKEFHFETQRMGSPEEIIKFINIRTALKPFIECIILGDDYYQLSSQHIKSAQESGRLNIILSKPAVINTRFKTQAHS